MATQVQTFDLREMIVTWGELMFDAGAGDGNFLTISYEGDLVEEHEGAQGDVTVLVRTSKLGTATIVLGQESPLNAQLAAAVLAMKRGAGLVRKPLVARRRGATFAATAANAWIRTFPELAFGDEHNNREWVFGLGDLEVVL